MIQANSRFSLGVFCFFLLSFLLPFTVFSQDTLTVVSYNLLNYGSTQAGCTNPTTTKNTQLSTIMPRLMPDLMGTCEMGTSALHATNILVNVLQPLNPAYEAAPYVGPSNSSQIVNMLFYNSDKLTLLDDHRINATNFVRDLNVWTLYYNSPDLVNGDTVFICAAMAHLKASQGTQNQNNRAAATTALMNYLAAQPRKMNTLFMGDFNLYTSSEPAYQNLLNPTNTSIRFFDPINTPGSWSGSATYSMIHTQSTRSTSESDCGSTGGSDDRFDFILANDYAMYDSAGIKVLSNTYKAFGQDGDLNAAVNAGSNGTIPIAIANALYTLSDHYPVTVDLAVSAAPMVSREDWFADSFLQIDVAGNPFEDELVLQVERTQASGISAEMMVVDLLGRTKYQQEIPSGVGQWELTLPTSTWSAGLYSLIVREKGGKHVVKKLIKR